MATGVFERWRWSALDLGLLHRIHQRGHALNADFEAVAGLDRADAAGCPGDDDIAGKQRHVRGDEADQAVAVEDELAGIRILAELAVLKKLNRPITIANSASKSVR